MLIYQVLCSFSLLFSKAVVTFKAFTIDHAYPAQSVRIRANLAEGLEESTKFILVSRVMFIGGNLNKITPLQILCVDEFPLEKQLVT